MAPVVHNREVHSGFDHVTIAVTDLDGARHFFGLLGFEETAAVVVSGDRMARYMGIPDWEADHVTLRLAGAATHQEVQLLRFHRPELPDDPHRGNLARLGFNHVCFAVDDLAATLATLAAAGIATRNEVMEFHDRKLVFLNGPDGVVVELAQWLSSPAPPEPADDDR
jgi:catechol 2,3-dioxygenase-like lactoylglutathione lyase family enzyme